MFNPYSLPVYCSNTCNFPVRNSLKCCCDEKIPTIKINISSDCCKKKIYKIVVNNEDELNNLNKNLIVFVNNDIENKYKQYKIYYL